MRFIIGAIVLLAAAPAVAQIKIPDACVKVAASYSVPAPSSLTRSAARKALAGLAHADQDDADVMRCIESLKAELKK